LVLGLNFKLGVIVKALILVCLFLSSVASADKKPPFDPSQPYEVIQEGESYDEMKSREEREAAEELELPEAPAPKPAHKKKSVTRYDFMEDCMNKGFSSAYCYDMTTYEVE
jgi:hypothetical protein